MPTCSAARITRVPLGTLTSTPSMVRVTSSSAGGAARRRRWLDGVAARAGLVVDGHAGTSSFANSVDAAGSNGQPPPVRCALVLLAEVLDAPR